MKRAVATITVYVFGHNDEELKNEANQVAHHINAAKMIDHNAKVESLHEQNFGTITKREIPL